MASIGLMYEKKYLDQFFDSSKYQNNECIESNLIEFFIKKHSGKKNTPFGIVTIKWSAYIKILNELQEKGIPSVPVIKYQGTDYKNHCSWQTIGRKNISNVRNLFEEIIKQMSQVKEDFLFSPQEISIMCMDIINQQISNYIQPQIVQKSIFSNCMKAIVIRHHVIYQLLEQSEFPKDGHSCQHDKNEFLSKISPKRYHITLEFTPNKDTVFSEFHQVKIIGVGSFTEEDGSYYSWILFDIDGAKKHISIDFPFGKAKMNSIYFRKPENNTLFEKSPDPIELISFPIEKKDMSLGITDHFFIVNDFDKTVGNVDLNRLEKENHSDKDNFKWLRSSDVMENFTYLTRYGKALLFSVDQLFITTSRRTLEERQRQNLQSKLQTKIDNQVGGPGHVQVIFSTQQSKIYEKSDQADDKMRRAHEFTKPIIGPFIMAEDDPKVIDRMIRCGQTVIKVGNNGQDIELIEPNIKLNFQNPHVVALIGPIGFGKSTIISKIVKMFPSDYGSINVYSTDELNKQGVSNAYKFIENQILQQNGGIVFVDSGFTSGIPEWITIPIILDHNGNSIIGFGISLARAISRTDHPTLKF